MGREVVGIKDRETLWNYYMAHHGRGAESRNAQAYLQKVIKALREVVDKKNRRKTQELMDEVYENLRAV